MPTRTILLALSLVTVVTASAHGGWWTGLQREIGWGWGDGYHSRTGCVPCEPKHAQSRYHPPGGQYEVPSWLYGTPSPALPEPIGPTQGVPSPPASLRTGGGTIQR